MNTRSLVASVVQPWARLRGHDSVWVSIQTARIGRAIDELIWGTYEAALTYRARRKMPAIIDHPGASKLSIVDRYWGSHTVRGRFFLSKQDSLDHIALLTDGRPLKRELLKLHGPHKGKTILDYGCGPGNDLAGFAEMSGAARIIGVDISERALQMARSRLSWHDVDPNILTFIKISDTEVSIPLADSSVDYIQSLGVIHHTTHPERVFKELARILKKDGEVRIMLYNADSVHVQLDIGYGRRLVDGVQSNLTPEQAFEKSADLGAPIAHCVRPTDVERWTADSGLKYEYLGGFFVPGEIDAYGKYCEAARGDARLTSQQREFLGGLTIDGSGIPQYKGLPAGLGAVYRLSHIKRWDESEVS